jgi:hypothetical protein
VLQVLSLGEEVVAIARAEYPLHVVPAMRHGVLALAQQALVLHLVPVVVGTPDGAAGEARLEGHREPLKDNVLRRMLPGKRLQAAAARKDG